MATGVAAPTLEHYSNSEGATVLAGTPQKLLLQVTKLASLRAPSALVRFITLDVSANLHTAQDTGCAVNSAEATQALGAALSEQALFACTPPSSE